MPRRRFEQSSRRRRGFTLMEVVVVVTIIALLATLVVPRIIGTLSGSKIKAAKTECNSLAQSVTLYVTDSGDALDDEFELELMLLPPEEGGGPSGPYLNKAEDLIDPWDNSYVIRIPGEVNYDFDIISFGPDREEGTEDDITQ